MGSTRISSALDVALEIERRLPGVGEAKLHKLLYYLQGYHLAWEQGPAFKEEIEAWELGPVVARLWRDRKRSLLHRLSRLVRLPKPLPESVRDITANVVCRLGDKTSAELIKAIHAEGPWRLATSNGYNIANQEISHQSLIEFFSAEPHWVRHMREHVATIRDDRDFVPDRPGALDAVMAKHFPG